MDQFFHPINDCNDLSKEKCEEMNGVFVLSWRVLAWYKHKNGSDYCIFRIYEILPLLELQLLVTPPQIVHITTQLQIFKRINCVASLIKLKLLHTDTINIIFSKICLTTLIVNMFQMTQIPS